MEPVIDLAAGAEREPLARELAERVRANVQRPGQRRAFELLRGAVVVLVTDDRTELTLRFDYGRLTIHDGVLGVPDLTVRGPRADLSALARLPLQSTMMLPLPRRADPAGRAVLTRVLRALGSGRLKIYGLIRRPRFVARLLLVLGS